MEEEWGLWQGQCVACDMYGRINDLQLCEICAAKLERDLVRLQDWDYTATAFTLPEEKWEAARKAIIKKYGPDLELIEPPLSKRKLKQRRRNAKKSK